MKKFLCLLFFLLSVFFLLSANPCFEEVEDTAFTTILSYSSIPKIPLDGVSYTESDDESALPERVTYSSADLSTFLGNLNTKPDCSSLWESAVYSMMQRGATMKKTKAKLEQAGYRKGDVTVSGTVDISSKTPLKKLELVLGNDFSSVDVDCTANLLLTKNGEKYIIKGTFNVSGDENRILSVTSSDMTVNGIYYRVSVKYRLTKVQ